MSTKSDNVDNVQLPIDSQTIVKADSATMGRKQDIESGKVEFVKPMNACIWRLMIASLVTIYGSYAVLVHLCEEGGKLTFSSTSFVLIVEITKFLMSVFMFIPEYKVSGFEMPSMRLAALYAVPAVLYFINNNLSIHMQLEMDPASYQVLCNLKILSTALLYRLIIKRPISYLQWFSLFLLAAAGALNSFGGLVARGSTGQEGFVYITQRGLQMVSIYCIISGMAGVYSEWILKDKYQMSIHIQNAMLYVFGIILNGSTWVYGAATSDDAGAFNLFQGYSLFTILLVANQALCGLLMSSVMKHGSNIIRLFVISGAMVVAMLLSVIIFHLQLNVYIITAAIIVLTALGLYYKK